MTTTCCTPCGSCGSLLPQRTDGTTKGRIDMASLEELSLEVLDLLIKEGGSITAPWGQCLTKIASAVFGRDIAVGDAEYKRTSLAVIYLEEADLVEVDRAYERSARKANIIISVRAVR